jgi:hypothetical protein
MHYATKAQRGESVLIRIFLNSAIIGVEWSGSRPGRFILGERSIYTHWIGGWVVPRTSLEDEAKRKVLSLPGLELLSLDRLTHSQSLYRLHYPISYMRVFQSGVSISLLFLPTVYGFPLIILRKIKENEMFAHMTTHLPTLI